MRHLYIGLIFILGCSTRNDDFQKYISQLETLEPPISLGTLRFPEIETDKNYDKRLFERFKYSTAQEVYGKIYESNKTVGVIYTVFGDYSIPILVTYDLHGNRIDSLNLFENAGDRFDGETYEYVTFLPDKTIQIIDSTRTWFKTGEYSIPGAGTLSVDTLICRISPDGRIIKDKKE